MTTSVLTAPWVTLFTFPLRTFLALIFICPLPGVSFSFCLHEASITIAVRFVISSLRSVEFVFDQNGEDFPVFAGSAAD
jgi:hypothetical protein